MRKKLLPLLSYILLLCVTVSSAWILQSNQGQYLELDYNSSTGDRLVLSSDDLEMQVFVANDYGELKKWGTSAEKTTTPFPIDPDRIIPGAELPFTLRFYNYSKETLTVSVSLSGLVCDSSFVNVTDGKEVVWVRAVGSSEYTKYTGIVERPREINKPLSGAWNGDAAEGNVVLDFVMYDEIQIPPTGEKDFVELECRIYFDSEHMTNVHQDKTFKITSFKATQ